MKAKRLHPAFRSLFRSLFRSFRFRTFRATAGFTLTELLIAIALTSLIVALAGQGFVALLQAQNRIDSEVSRRTDLTRSLEFIADEIRMARSIAVPASSDIPTQTCGTAIGVLNLTLPHSNSLSNVVYYIHNQTGCSNSLWAGPAVIYRRERVRSTGAWANPTVLVDALAAPATLPTCSPSRTGANGFYVCIQDSRTATVLLYGVLEDSLGNTTTRPPYEVRSQVTARSF